MFKTIATIAIILVAFAALGCVADKATESADASSVPLSDVEASVSDEELHGYTNAEIINLYKAEVRKSTMLKLEHQDVVTKQTQEHQTVVTKFQVLLGKLQDENSQLREKGVSLGETENSSNQVVALDEALALTGKGDAPLRVNDCQVADGCCVARSLEAQLCGGVSVDQMVPGDGAAAQEGSTFVPPCADDPNCNPAKCAGDKQDNSMLRGDLDCESEPFEGKETHKGNKCIDNLSSGMFFISSTGGGGQCVDFGDKRSSTRVTYSDSVNPDSPRFGTISKMIVAHPDKTSKKYGLIFGKRMTCVGSKCFVFKQGFCIKCPQEVFKSTRESHADSDDYIKFSQCCVHGKWNYIAANGTMFKCHADFRSKKDSHGNYEGPPGAFTAKNSADAKLKPSYQCWDGQSTEKDARDADGAWAKVGKLAHKLAEDLMKAG